MKNKLRNIFFGLWVKPQIGDDVITFQKDGIAADLSKSCYSDGKFIIQSISL